MQAAAAQPYLAFQPHQITRGDIVQAVCDSETSTAEPISIVLRGKNGVPHGLTDLGTEKLDELQRENNEFACANAVVPKFTARCVTGTKLAATVHNIASAQGSIQLYPTCYNTTWHTDTTGTVNIGLGRLEEKPDHKLVDLLGPELASECQKSVNLSPADDGLKCWLLYPVESKVTDFTSFLDCVDSVVYFVWRQVRIEVPVHFVHSVMTVSSYVGFGYFWLRPEAVLSWCYYNSLKPILQSAMEDGAENEPNRVCSKLIGNIESNKAHSKRYRSALILGLHRLPQPQFNQYRETLPRSHPLQSVFYRCVIYKTCLNAFS